MKLRILLLAAMFIGSIAHASIAPVASTVARNNDTDGDVATTLGAAVAEGDTIICGVLNRTDETTTITGFSDSVNGAWPSPVAGPVDSIGTTFRSWFYVFENSASGTPTITATFSGSITSELTCIAIHGTEGTPVLDVLGTTYNTSGETETNIDTAAVAATGAGILVGVATFNVFQGTTPTMDGAGENVQAAGGASSRAFVTWETVSGAGNVSFEMTLTSASRVIYFQATFVEDDGEGGGDDDIVINPITGEGAGAASPITAMFTQDAANDGAFRLRASR